MQTITIKLDEITMQCYSINTL